MGIFTSLLFLAGPVGSQTPTDAILPPYPVEDARALILAEADLPAMPIAVPDGVGGFLGNDQTDRALDLAEEVRAAYLGVGDYPSVGWIGPAMRRVSALLATGEARLSSVYGPASRAVATYLAVTQWIRNHADGWAAMAMAAERAVAIERQLSANALLFSDIHEPGGPPSVRGTGTDVLEAVLLVLVMLTLEDRVAGAVSPSPTEELAFRLAQASFVGDSAVAAVRPFREDPDLSVQAKVNQDVYHVQALFEELSWFHLLGGYGGTFLDPEAVFARAEQAAREAAQGLAALQSASVNTAAVFFPRIYSLAEVQEALRPDEAVVMIVPAEGVAVVFAVTRDGFLMRETQASLVDLWDSAERLRMAVGRPSGRGAIALDETAERPTDRDLLRTEAAAIYDALLAPVEDILGPKPRLFVLAPGGMGLGFPFEMLLTAPAAPGQPDKDLDWLVKRHAVTVVPTLELIRTRGSITAEASGRTTYLGLGAPDYTPATSIEWVDLRAERILSALTPLPESGDEVRRVAAAFAPEDGLAVTGLDANEATLFEASRSGLLRQFTVLHFATHGLVYEDHQDVADPLLALTPTPELLLFRPEVSGRLRHPTPDGLLEAHEVRQLDLAARLVILSACSSGAAGPDTDGLTSLGSAFLAAGAERVLGTHWPVYSDAAVEIVTGMAKRDPLLADPSLALRDTLVSLIESGGRKADPTWWAAFSLVGRP